jgi:hypothetical protein
MIVIVAVLAASLTLLLRWLLINFRLAVDDGVLSAIRFGRPLDLRRWLSGDFFTRRLAVDAFFLAFVAGSAAFALRDQQPFWFIAPFALLLCLITMIDAKRGHVLPLFSLTFAAAAAICQLAANGIVGAVTMATGLATAMLLWWPARPQTQPRHDSDTPVRQGIFAVGDRDFFLGLGMWVGGGELAMAVAIGIVAGYAAKVMRRNYAPIPFVPFVTAAWLAIHFSLRLFDIETLFQRLFGGLI